MGCSRTIDVACAFDLPREPVPLPAPDTTAHGIVSSFPARHINVYPSTLDEQERLLHTFLAPRWVAPARCQRAGRSRRFVVFRSDVGDAESRLGPPSGSDCP